MAAPAPTCEPRLMLVRPLAPTAGMVAWMREIAPGDGAGSAGRRKVVPLLWAGVAAVVVVLLARRSGEFVTAIERALHTGWRLVVLAALFEALSVGGYVLLLHRVV